MKRAEQGEVSHHDRFRFDLTSVLIAVLVIAVLLLLTFELWTARGHTH
jgi:competence protein ComGC